MSWRKIENKNEGREYKEMLVSNKVLKNFNLELLPGIAGILALVSFSTLLMKVYKTHNTTSFPYSWILVNMSAQILALVYGVAKGAYGIYLPAILFIVGLLYLLAVKVFSQDYPVKGEKVPEAGQGQEAEKKS